MPMTRRSTDIIIYFIQRQSFFTMMFSLKTAFVATALLASAQAFPSGAGGCDGGQAAVNGFHLSELNGKTIETGSLTDGNVGLLLNGVPLDPAATTAVNFTAGAVNVLTLAGTSPYRGLLIRLAAPSGVDTTTALLEVSDDLKDAAGVCTAPVVGITHTNSDLKFSQSVSLMIAAEGEVTLDVTVVVANNATDSIYYYSGYTLNAVMEEVVNFVNPVCEVCGAGLVVGLPDVIVSNPLDGTTPTCAEIQGGGQAGLIPAAFCDILSGAITALCGCEAADRQGDGDGGETTSSPTMAPASGAATAAGQQQTLVALAVSGLVAAFSSW
jgi:hypothetical protein